MLGGSVVACCGVLHFPRRILDNTVCLCGRHPEPLMGVTAGGQKLQRGTVITGGYFWDKEITKTLTITVIEYMSTHLLPRRKSWARYRQIWNILRKGREVRSHMDYLMGTYRCLLHIISIWDDRHNIYQYLVLGCICGAAATDHSQYLRRWWSFPVRPSMNLT